MKTQSEAVQWALAQEGKSLSWGGYSQCVAFIRNYVNFLGYKQPPFVPGAKDLWAADWGPEFTKHPDPQPGDIGILGPSTVNKDGHIDIVVEVVPGNLVTMDQNLTNPFLGGVKGSPIDKIVWKYPNSRFLGFVRPKFKEEYMFEGKTAQEWAIQAKDAEQWKQAVVKSKAFNRGIAGKLENVTFVMDDLQDFKDKTLATGVVDPDGEKWRTFKKLLG